MQIKFFEILLDFYFIFVYKYPYIGWVAEWLKAHAWKVCLGRKPNASSNLAPSAIKSSLQLKTFLINPVWIARKLVIFCFGCDWGGQFCPELVIRAFFLARPRASVKPCLLKRSRALPPSRHAYKKALPLRGAFGIEPFAKL